MIDRYSIEQEEDNLYHIYYRPPLVARAVLRLLCGDDRLCVSDAYADDEAAWTALAGILISEQDARGALLAAEYSNLLHRRKNHGRHRIR